MQRKTANLCQQNARHCWRWLPESGIRTNCRCSWQGRSCCQSKVISCGEALRRAEAMGSCVATNLSCRLMGFTRWVKYAFGGWYRSLQHAVEQARRLEMAKITVNLGMDDFTQAASHRQLQDLAAASPSTVHLMEGEMDIFLLIGIKSMLRTESFISTGEENDATKDT
jgi:hypothetical protein